MIGLGSNRLTVCRRGGMSVTQAGRGGMEWLAGGRMPSWASPYSAAATAALKAQFSAEQWPTIRDYGFAHPEIVGYMNAYATEDAKIAYSLVPTLGVRSIVTDGSAKFALGYKYTTDMTLELDCTPATIANETCFLTNGNWAANTPLWIIYQSTIRWHIASGGSVDWNGTVSANTRYDIKVGNGYVEVNGVRTTKGDGSYNNNANLILFGLSISTGTSHSYIGKAHSLKVNGNSHDEWWVPFVRNNVKGWLEMKGNTFMAPSCGTIDITEQIS